MLESITILMFHYTGMAVLKMPFQLHLSVVLFVHTYSFIVQKEVIFTRM